MDSELLAQCTAIYEEMPGWQESTFGVQSVADLPTNARNYIDRLQQLCGVGISIISTGPDRAETIVLEHPFEANTAQKENVTA